MKKQNLKEKGITLIALVVTVVVLLILAGVTITLMFGDNNIFDLAKNAGDKTNQAIEDETDLVDKVTSDINKWENGGNSSGDLEKEPTLPKGWSSSKVSIVPRTESKPVPLPNGFVVSGIAEEQNVNTGLVIYQIPATEITDDIWTKNETGDANILDVQEKYNQFVWVPVDNPSEMFGTDKDGNSIGKLYNFSTSRTTKCNWEEDTDNLGKIKWTSNTGYREPDVVSYDNNTNTGTNDFKAQLQGEFETMKTSVETYGGFYIGRYETGNLSQDTVKVVKGNTDISSQTWYTMYKKSKKFANGTNLTSSMIWGCQWDRTLEWIVDTNRTAKENTKDYTIVTNSSSWGNYNRKWKWRQKSHRFK